jgi:hypothetical protein
MDADASTAVEAANAAASAGDCNGFVNSDLVSAKVLSKMSRPAAGKEVHVRNRGGRADRHPDGPTHSAEILRREGYANILKDIPDIESSAEPTCNRSREKP